MPSPLSAAAIRSALEVAIRPRWPNLFLVGAAKAGTTSLYAALARHPKIYMSPMKEPHFFSRIQPAARWEAFFPHVSDEDEYLALFGGVANEPVVGEASTSYLWDREAAGRIARAVPRAKILIVLRDPVDRAYSHYRNDVREGMERRTFIEALEAEQRDGAGGWGASSLYLDCGRYAGQVERYLGRFEGRVKVLFFDDLVGDEAGTIAGVHGFLGVQPASGELGERMNPGSQPRNRLSGAMLASGRLRAIVRSTVPRGARARLRSALLRQAPAPPMDPAARELLTRAYRPEIEPLERLLGRPVPWRARWENRSVRGRP